VVEELEYGKGKDKWGKQDEMKKAMLDKAAARLARLVKPSDDEEEKDDEEGDDKGEKDEAEDQGEGDKPDEKPEAKDDEEDEEDSKNGEDGEEGKERQEDSEDKDDDDKEDEEAREAKPSKAKKEDNNGKGRGKEDGRRPKARKVKSKAEAKLLKQEPKVEPRKTTNEKGEPIDPGCYVLMPDGCPGKSWGSSPWKRDVWGEANVGAGTDRDVCENKRKIKFNNWCGKDNARMLFVEGGPADPSEPGCFYWHPSGCPAHDKQAAKEWIKDESDEEGITQAACEGQRKAALDKWCGVSDTRTLFVHEKPETPEYPGCYVWMPNGCALHKFDARKGWKRDAWGEDNTNAGQDKAVCEKRKFNFNTWCGIGDTQMLFVEAKA